MILFGAANWLAIAILAFLIASSTKLLYAVLNRQPKPSEDAEEFAFRRRFQVAALVATAVSLLLVIVFHATWISPAVSQAVGRVIVQPLGWMLVLTLAGGMVGAVFGGGGGARWFSLGICIALFAWYASLSVRSAALGPPVIRHQTHFIVPNDYTGWVELRYGVASATALPEESGGVRVCRFLRNGMLETSTLFETGWANDDYTTAGGAKVPVVLTELEPGAAGHEVVRAFIGTEDDYLKAKARRP